MSYFGVKELFINWNARYVSISFDDSIEPMVDCLKVDFFFSKKSLSTISTKIPYAVLMSILILSIEFCLVAFSGIFNTISSFYEIEELLV